MTRDVEGSTARGEGRSDSRMAERESGGQTTAPGFAAAATRLLPISLVICTLDRPQCVARLLEAVVLAPAVPREILVVDATSPVGVAEVTGSTATAPDATRQVVEALVASSVDGSARGPALPTALPNGIVLRHLRVDRAQRGLTRQRNVGIAQATQELIAFLDDDTVPDPDYFDLVVSAFERHPTAVGVGGWIDDGLWHRVPADPENDVLRANPGTGDDSHRGKQQGGWFVVREWRRRLPLRWHIRTALGLGASSRAGLMPEAGHGLPISFLPPSGEDVPVDFVMGGASAWRRELFRSLGFSTWFDGYGLYEDLDFSIRARSLGPLWVATGARLVHLHEPSARPQPLRYGKMVVRNGWRVWRTAHPAPKARARVSWWATTLLLAGLRAANGITGPNRREAIAEAVGRVLGVFGVLVAPPGLAEEGEAPLIEMAPAGGASDESAPSVESGVSVSLADEAPRP